ncbi:beta-hexosaminidase 2 isoform X2 [Solanum dulcamara]|uniref:beta-hexosaminidase 2 isoform X2 n=1 Tax=Solanum dulcamara TaxID=45834 RepID=UPI00248650CF|nr:beta-hexosaminidase 2 isoform X2 [Solanum dulcamara]
MRGEKTFSSFLPLFLISISFFIFISQTTATNYYPINVWPKPTTFHWPNPKSIFISPNFTISHPYHRYLTPAVDRYRRLILSENHRPIVSPAINLTSLIPLQSLIISVSDVTSPLAHGVNESYSLSTSSDVSSSAYAYITAETVWGAMRGLETFSQLVYGNPTRVAAGVYIHDLPIFTHRGVMLDTSRNFYGVDHVLRLIKALSMNKLNVFHWHITDSHSFPLVIPSEPELAGKGAYGNEMMYSPADVQKIVEYGLERGVRVLPEIDMPGSWAEAYPEIVTCANMFWWPAGSSPALAAEPGTGQLNPLIPKTYEVVKNVIQDTIAMFPDSLFHGGADEINSACWNTDPSVQKFVASNGTLSQLLEKFINNTLPEIISLNRTVVYWEDVILSGNVKVNPSLLSPQNVIMQTWNGGPTNTKQLVTSGYRVIVSSADYYYLDCGHGSFVGNDSRYDQPPGTDQGNGGSWCGPFKTWETIYNYDITYGLTDDEAQLVIGGEVALWSEQADSTVMDSRIWPRASAMAETLWSGNRDETGMKRYAEATDRLNEWRYRMVSRGIGAEPIQPLWCLKNPGMCNTVHPFTS